jgi:protein-disulfide isomerase
LNKQTKLSLALVGAFALVVAVMLGLTAMSGPEPTPVGDGESLLVREDSHVLGPEGESGVTFVEFLDFECEACLAAYPAVEQLREDYAGEVTFVVRHFPLHFNSERAARAVEAAARQGAFEEMYQQMYDTATQWGHSQDPADETFIGFAEDLGLDAEQFRADYEDPAIAAKVARDQEDGTELGVEGTPTFFVDGERIQPQTYDDFTEALDAALAD